MKWLICVKAAYVLKEKKNPFAYVESQDKFCFHIEAECFTD